MPALPNLVRVPDGSRGRGYKREGGRHFCRPPNASLPWSSRRCGTAGLEFLTQGKVIETITDRVERRIVVVVKRSQDRRWLAVKRVDHACRALDAPKHPLPDRAITHTPAHWLLRAALEILPLLRITGARRFHRRSNELVA